MECVFTFLLGLIFLQVLAATLFTYAVCVCYTLYVMQC